MTREPGLVDWSDTDAVARAVVDLKRRGEMHAASMGILLPGVLAKVAAIEQAEGEQLSLEGKP